MNGQYDQQLDREIDRILRNLPELEAPGSLVGKVMRRLEQRSAEVWYRRSWQTWTVGMRATALVALVTVFVGLCYAGLEFSHADISTVAGHRVGEWFSNLVVVKNTLIVLLNSTCLVIKKLGTVFFVACLFAVGLGYIMCVGLGTMYLRLAFIKQ